jgi:hypothetical protein
MRLPYVIAAANLCLLAGALIVAGGLDDHVPFIPGIAVVFTPTGALVANRQPRNPIGWLLLGTGTAAGLATLGPAIADRGLEAGGTPSLGTRLAADYASASWIPMMLPGLTFLLLLFPDGRLLSPRWRKVAWAAGFGIVGGLASTMVTPGRLEDYPELTNPLGVEAVKGLDGPLLLLTMAAVLASAASLVVRYRRADVVTREQIKWIAFAGAIAASVFTLGFALFGLLPESVIYGAMMTGVLGLPVAASIAILRYRLYDIDVVINRALVYTVLTMTLVGAYLLTVLLAQLVLPARSDLGVAVSTLAAAALFTPARRRIQSAVDRRFFRSRFDAQRTLESFGARLRDEVDLDALRRDLTGTVADTMQPNHISLWVRAT